MRTLMYPGLHGVGLHDSRSRRRRRSRVRAEALSRGVPPQGSRSSGRWPSRCLVAADLGTSAQTIYAWRKQELVGTGQQPGLSRAEQTELSAANKRIRELENKVAILKRPVSCSESHTTRRSIRGGLLRMAITATVPARDSTCLAD